MVVLKYLTHFDSINIAGDQNIRQKKNSIKD
jgi:hypothetical protein